MSLTPRAVILLGPQQNIAEVLLEAGDVAWTEHRLYSISKS